MAVVVGDRDGDGVLGCRSVVAPFVVGSARKVGGGAARLDRDGPDGEAMVENEHLP